MKLLSRAACCWGPARLWPSLIQVISSVKVFTVCETASVLSCDSGCEWGRAKLSWVFLWLTRVWGYAPSHRSLLLAPPPLNVKVVSLRVIETRKLSSATPWVISPWSFSHIIPFLLLIIVSKYFVWIYIFWAEVPVSSSRFPLSSHFSGLDSPQIVDWKKKGAPLWPSQ